MGHCFCYPGHLYMGVIPSLSPTCGGKRLLNEQVVYLMVQMRHHSMENMDLSDKLTPTDRTLWMWYHHLYGVDICDHGS